MKKTIASPTLRLDVQRLVWVRVRKVTDEPHDDWWVDHDLIARFFPELCGNRDNLRMELVANREPNADSVEMAVPGPGASPWPAKRHVKIGGQWTFDPGCLGSWLEGVMRVLGANVAHVNVRYWKART